MKNINDFITAKKEQTPLSMITAYDYSFAKIVSKTDIDMILVGDSVAMVVHGHDSTIHATMEMMQLHTSAVRRGATNKFIIGDMPFMSNREGVFKAAKNASLLIKSGANAVKIEGAGTNCEAISYIVESGIPVMGHLGLTPQSVNQLGGYKVQGRGAAGTKLVKDAIELEKLGCFALVLECVPATLAQEVAKTVSIPVIGIGAGVNVDGQVLVEKDLLGIDDLKAPKFVRRYSNLNESILSSLTNYHNDVRSMKFPNEQESYQ